MTARAASPLEGVVAVFGRWLYLEDAGIVRAVLAAVVANKMVGDPVWLMCVGPPSGGKTEVMNAVSALPGVHAAATLTEAALLSGTPKRDRDREATGGLLRLVGESGILVCKDFTSILSMNRDPRAALLAALREIYDGAWTRHVGVDGGKTFAWTGKLGLLAACTSTIDGHHAVMATMGERFLFYRLPEVDPLKQGHRALANTGKESAMRRELSTAVRDLFATLQIPDEPPPLSPVESRWLVALAALAARARSAVERDGRTREIELIPDAEAPARMAQALRRLYAGLCVLEVDADEVWRIVTKVALDCMPKLRLAVFRILQQSVGRQVETGEVARELGYPLSTVRRALEDLAVHGVADHEQGGTGSAGLWGLSPWTISIIELLLNRTATETFPEKSVTEQEPSSASEPLMNPHRVHDDFSGKVGPPERGELDAPHANGTSPAPGEDGSSPRMESLRRAALDAIAKAGPGASHLAGQVPRMSMRQLLDLIASQSVRIAMETGTG